MSIEKALQEYIETQALSEKELSGIPSASRPGWESVKREAKDAVPSKFRALQLQIERGSTSIGVAGDPASVKDFVDLADKRQDTVIVTRDDLYRTIAERLMPHIGGSNQFGPAQFNLMLTIFRGLVTDMGIQVLVAPKFRDTVTVHDTHELTGVVKGLVEESIGDALVVRFLRDEVTRQVIKKQTVGDKLFVVVIDGDHQTMDSLSAKSLAIKVSPPVTGENVTEVFDELLGRGKKNETIQQQPQTKKKQKNKKEEENEQ